MAEISSLYRTFSPKYTHYAPDGYGRDVYINDNNGGLLKNIIKGENYKESSHSHSKFYTFHSLK